MMLKVGKVHCSQKLHHIRLRFIDDDRIKTNFISGFPFQSNKNHDVERNSHLCVAMIGLKKSHDGNIIHFRRDTQHVRQHQTWWTMCVLLKREIPTDGIKFTKYHLSDQKSKSTIQYNGDNVGKQKTVTPTPFEHRIIDFGRFKSLELKSSLAEGCMHHPSEFHNISPRQTLVLFRHNRIQDQWSLSSMLFPTFSYQMEHISSMKT